MAIDFPCLSKDLSSWSPKNNNADQDLVSSLKSLNISHEDKDRTAEKIVDQPSYLNSWLVKNNHGDSSNRASSQKVDIMSPVLKDTPKSAWLVEKKPETMTVEKETREANLSTSLWLATSSSEPFTCVTKATSEATSIQWPEILFHNSPTFWLQDATKVERNDIDQWLITKVGEKDRINLSQSNNIFENWLQSHAEAKWTIDVQVTKTLKESSSSPAVDHLTQNWLAPQRGSTDFVWLHRSKSAAAMEENQLSSLNCSTSSISKSESVEKWLCLAIQEDPSLNDDDSSIAVLEYQAETHLDDMELQEEPSEASDFCKILFF